MKDKNLQAFDLCKAWRLFIKATINLRQLSQENKKQTNKPTLKKNSTLNPARVTENQH